VWSAGRTGDAQKCPLDKPIETIGEDVTGQPDAALELLEPSGSVERLAHDHPHSAFADDRPGAGDRAILFEKFGVLYVHEDSRGLVSFSKRGIQSFAVQYGRPTSPSATK
jgi:hypothetical protein